MDKTKPLGTADLTTLLSACLGDEMLTLTEITAALKIAGVPVGRTRVSHTLKTAKTSVDDIVTGRPLRYTWGALVRARLFTSIGGVSYRVSTPEERRREVHHYGMSIQYSHTWRAPELEGPATVCIRPTPDSGLAPDRPQATQKPTRKGPKIRKPSKRKRRKPLEQGGDPGDMRTFLQDGFNVYNEAKSALREFVVGLKIDDD